MPYGQTPNYENAICISKLSPGQKFAKIIKGTVGSKIYRLEGSLGGMFKVTLLPDNDPAIINRRLILPL